MIDNRKNLSEFQRSRLAAIRFPFAATSVSYASSKSPSIPSIKLSGQNHRTKPTVNRTILGSFTYPKPTIFNCGTSFHKSVRASFMACSIERPALVIWKILFLRPPLAFVAPPMSDFT